MKIYTKKGDKGYTSNFLGEAVKKSDDVLHLQGTVDEVNAMIGHLRSLLDGEGKVLDAELRDIQYALFRLGADIASRFETVRIVEKDVKILEERIDVMTEAFGAQTSFIYYSGHVSATYTQTVRSVVRRAERCFVAAYEVTVSPMDLQYLNRLADYFYAVARYLNYCHKIDDEKMEIR